jgi:hypothetical protein
VDAAAGEAQKIVGKIVSLFFNCPAFCFCIIIPHGVADYKVLPGRANKITSYIYRH